jgi:hypothetical protein
MQETAEALGLGEETVRSHFKKAQIKLGTRNRKRFPAPTFWAGAREVMMPGHEQASI